MGYEQTIYVGEPTRYTLNIDNGKRWFQVFGMIDLCKVGGILAHQHIVDKGIPVFIFGSDGDTKIEEDRYGASLKAIPIEHILENLKKMNEHVKYTRSVWAYDMLKSMSKKRKDFHGMTATHCIIFGH